MVEGIDKIGELNNGCSSCGSFSTVRDYRLGSVICGDCGRIIRDGIKDRGPDWREYSQEERENRNRGGAPITQTIHDKGLSTQIPRNNRDGKGNSLSSEKRFLMYRLRKRQKSANLAEQRDRNLATAFSELNRMSSQLGLPKKIREIAAKTYREAVDRDLIRGHSIESVTAAALYVACRKSELPRTLDEISEVSHVDKTQVGKSYRYISRNMDIQLPPIDPGKYVSRFGSDLNLSGETRTQAIRLIRKAQENKLTSGRSPASIGAAAIYISSLLNDEKKSQREVAETASITSVTLRSRYKELSEELGIDTDL